MDTSDSSSMDSWKENLQEELAGSRPDYLIIHQIVFATPAASLRSVQALSRHANHVLSQGQTNDVHNTSLIPSP